MNVKESIAVSLKDVYQLLVAECRYGYTRNNHLMPDGAYEKAMRLVPAMFDVDEEYALHTARQLCDECISYQLDMHFADGEDDEHGNRKAAIKFVEWLIEWIHEHEKDSRYDNYAWFPYNYELFSNNKAKDDEPRYWVYEIGDERTLLTPTPLSEREYVEFMLKSIDIDAESAVYRREESPVSSDFRDRRRNYVYHFIEPTKKDFYVEHI